MIDEWVELTPVPELEDPAYAGGKTLVNLANATSIWPMANNTSEIWFGAAGDSARRFYVRETPSEILALRKRPAS